MIYLLFAVTALIYFYMLNCYIVYNKQHIAHRAASGEEQKKRAWFPFSRFVEKMDLTGLVPFPHIHSKRIAYLTSVSQELAKFFGILALAGLFYSVLQFWLNYSYSANKASWSILQIERSIHRIQAAVKPFKLSGIPDIILVTVLIALAGSLPILSKLKLKERYQTIMKVMGTVTMVLTVFTSFSFFGSRFRENQTGHVGELQLHKLQIIKENKLLVHDVAELVVDKVATQYIRDDLSGLMHEVDMLLHNIENPIDLNDSDTLYNLNTIESLKPVIANRLKVLAEEMPKTFNYDHCGEKAMNHLAAYLDRHPREVSNFVVRTASYAGGGPTSGRSFSTQVDEAIDNQLYHAFDQLEDGKVSTKNISLQTIQEIRAKVNAVKASPNVGTGMPWTTKYEESVKKLIKFGLGKTVNQWIGDFFGQLASDNPFVGNIIDPIINDPVQDYITNKVIKVFQAGSEKDEMRFASELEATGSEVSAIYKDKLYDNEKIRALGDEIKRIQSQIAIQKSGIIRDIYAGQQSAIERCHRMKYAGRFAQIRENARRRLEDGLTMLKGESLELARRSFEGWDEYLGAHEVEIGLSKYNDVEHFFADYCAYNPEMAATWGFILIAEPDIQQDIEAKYAESIQEEGHIKPAHGQFYYFEKYGYTRKEVIEHIVNPSAEQVAVICRNRNQ